MANPLNSRTGNDESESTFRARFTNWLRSIFPAGNAPAVDTPSESPEGAGDHTQIVSNGVYGVEISTGRVLHLNANGEYDVVEGTAEALRAMNELRQSLVPRRENYWPQPGDLLVSASMPAYLVNDAPQLNHGVQSPLPTKAVVTSAQLFLHQRDPARHDPGMQLLLDAVYREVSRWRDCGGIPLISYKFTLNLGTGPRPAGVRRLYSVRLSYPKEATLHVTNEITDDLRSLWEVTVSTPVDYADHPETKINGREARSIEFRHEQ